MSSMFPRRLEMSSAPRPTTRAVLLAVIPAADLDLYPARPLARMSAHTDDDAMQLIARTRPQVVAIDWDIPGIDAAAICAAARPYAGVLVTTADVGRAPAALKAGCHSLLLKPVTRNLVATRVGRLLAALARGESNGSGKAHAVGTNLSWFDAACPRCGEAGATSFEFLSHRRAWYACLACNHVWIERRREGHDRRRPDG